MSRGGSRLAFPDRGFSSQPSRESTAADPDLTVAGTHADREAEIASSRTKERCARRSAGAAGGRERGGRSERRNAGGIQQWSHGHSERAVAPQRRGIMADDKKIPTAEPKADEIKDLPPKEVS